MANMGGISEHPEEDEEEELRQAFKVERDDNRQGWRALWASYR